jgi:hypothetical protein
VWTDWIDDERKKEKYAGEGIVTAQPRCVGFRTTGLLFHGLSTAKRLSASQ